MKNSHHNVLFQNSSVRGLIRVLIGVGVGAGLMAIAIAWRVIHRPHGASFFPILGWQMLIWLPWIAYYYAVRYLVRRLGTYQDATLAGLLLHVLAASTVASSHLVWFWQISSHVSPFLDKPGTGYGVFPFFFIFWFFIDLLLYAAIFAKPEPDQDSREPLASNATTERFAVRKGRSQHLIRTVDIRWIEAQGYYAALHTNDGSFLLRRSLTRLEDDLDPECFIRVHRSTIVNVDHVHGLTTNTSGSSLVMLADGTQRGISRDGRRKLRSALPSAT